jgi:hypothetical protein
MAFQLCPERTWNWRAATLAACALLSSTPFSSTLSAAADQKAKFDSRDLNGSWNRYPDTSDQVDRTVQPPPPDIPPPPLKPQHLAEWKARQKAVADANARGEPPVTSYVKCLPDGMPAMMMAMFPMEVLQSPGRVTIIEEAFNQVRRIYLDQQQLAIEDAEPGFWGHSVGHWEGDTLLVDTVGIKENVRFRNVPHSDQLRISERIRLLSPEYLEDRITVTDPVFLTGAWSWVWKYSRKPGYKLYEYVCEDNREYADPATGAQRMKITKP